ncbi:MAG TPA: phosphoribosyltransferase [Candidatus Angelobacter sp.]|nr:phosphoribosyltransferase [Candidatus Angelobacter sp.]
MPFPNRSAAGRLLGEDLRALAGRSDIVVLALPRGGVPVAAEIAEVLDAPLFVFVVRKLGVPGHKELAMGAITSGGKRLINRAVTTTLHIPEDMVDRVAWEETVERMRRERLYGRGREMPELNDKIVIIVDDGIATGSTMMLAVQALREQQPGRIVVAVPVAPAEVVSQLSSVADEVICLAEPQPFVAVGAWYEDFHELSDQEVCTILDRVLERQPELKSA